MNRIFFLFLSIVVTLSISACASNESQNVENDRTTNSSNQFEDNGDTRSDKTSNLNENNIFENEGEAENESESEEITIDSLVDSYNFNSTTDNQLEYVEDFEVQNKESGHYRTEFRLSAYKEAVGKSYKMGEHTVDFITYSNMFTGQDFRIYANGITLELCIELIRGFSPLLDNAMSDDTVEETIDYVTENKEANGYYYGELGLLLLGNDTKGYDLMIKTD